MLTFKETSFVIEIETGSCPVEEWLATYNALLYLMQMVDKELLGDATECRIYSLLNSMLPDLEQARKMAD